jgi:hypothetical protein
MDSTAFSAADLATIRQRSDEMAQAMRTETSWSEAVTWAKLALTAAGGRRPAVRRRVGRIRRSAGER